MGRQSMKIHPLIDKTSDLEALVKRLSGEDFIAVDTEFRRFVRDTYHKGRRVSDLTMLRRYSKWGRWKYLAYWAELWNSVAGRLQPERDEDQ